MNKKQKYYRNQQNRCEKNQIKFPEIKIQLKFLKKSMDGLTYWTSLRGKNQ